jgi:antitoxin component YwqK of YwqJK toxin-antitoxin module
MEYTAKVVTIHKMRPTHHPNALGRSQPCMTTGNQNTAILKQLVLIGILSSHVTLTHLAAQSRDIRAHAEYGTSEGELRLKYEFYHDMWSERDVKHGRYCEWQTKDRIQMTGFYFDGLQDSLWQYYYGNGAQKEKSWWAEGERHGKTSSYSKKGKLRSERYYSQGICNGLGTDYYPNGKVKAILQYQSGDLHGNVTTYNRNGIRKDSHKYQEGKRVKEKAEKDPKRTKESTKAPNENQAPVKSQDPNKTREPKEIQTPKERVHKTNSADAGITLFVGPPQHPACGPTNDIGPPQHPACGPTNDIGPSQQPADRNIKATNPK